MAYIRATELRPSKQCQVYSAIIAHFQTLPLVKKVQNAQRAPIEQAHPGVLPKHDRNREGGRVQDQHKTQHQPVTPSQQSQVAQFRASHTYQQVSHLTKMQNWLIQYYTISLWTR